MPPVENSVNYIWRLRFDYTIDLIKSITASKTVVEWKITPCSHPYVYVYLLECCFCLVIKPLDLKPYMIFLFPKQSRVINTPSIRYECVGWHILIQYIKTKYVILSSKTRHFYRPLLYVLCWI